jgi:tetratricopeptide (TPR) repeat protein
MLLDALARNLRQQARYAEALAAFDEALALRREALGTDHPFTARTLAARAVLLAELGDLANAVPDSVRATFAIANVTGLQHPDSAEAERQRAEVLLLQGETVNALERVDVAIAGLEGAPGVPPPAPSVKLHILRARLLLARERPRDALAEARAAEELARVRIGAGTPLHAAALAALAPAAAAMGEASEAESALREALSIQARQLGPTHPVTLSTAALAGQLTEEPGRVGILVWARMQADQLDGTLARPHVVALQALEAAEARVLDRRPSRLRSEALAEFLANSLGTATPELIGAAALRARLAPLGEPPDWAALRPGLQPFDPEASP